MPATQFTLQEADAALHRPARPAPAAHSAHSNPCPLSLSQWAGNAFLCMCLWRLPRLFTLEKGQAASGILLLAEVMAPRRTRQAAGRAAGSGKAASTQPEAGEGRSERQSRAAEAVQGGQRRRVGRGKKAAAAPAPAEAAAGGQQQQRRSKRQRKEVVVPEPEQHCFCMEQPAIRVGTSGYRYVFAGICHLPSPPVCPLLGIPSPIVLSSSSRHLLPLGTPEHAAARCAKAALSLALPRLLASAVQLQALAARILWRPAAAVRV
jgi:hypothetical protein